MKFGLVAGEASGDVLGAGLIRALRERIPDATFEGVAGPAMVEAGCDQWEAADSLAVMGLVEPLRHIPRLLRLRRELARRWIASPPDVFIGIDAPDFNLGLESKLRRAGIRTAHYVSPSIWAWRPGRVKKVRKAADTVLCILPFEPRLYEQHGVRAVFVGHPKAHEAPARVDQAAARKELGVEAETIVRPSRSLITCTVMCLLLRNTAKRGRSAVPVIFLRTRRCRRRRPAWRCDDADVISAQSPDYFLPVLPALSRTRSLT